MQNSRACPLRCSLPAIACVTAVPFFSVQFFVVDRDPFSEYFALPHILHVVLTFCMYCHRLGTGRGEDPSLAPHPILWQYGPFLAPNACQLMFPALTEQVRGGGARATITCVVVD